MNKQVESYEHKLNTYMEQNLHPDTAENIGKLIFHSPLGTSEFAMSIILEMVLDPLRKESQSQPNS